jgi:hypothetical protein
VYYQTQHAHSYLENQELLWCPMDTEDRYLKHLQTHKSDLEKYNWIDNNFTYKFNSYGFRSEEFCNSDNMISLGCSHTMGIGLPIENTWAYIVSNRLKLKNFNFGIAGGSNDSSFRMAYNWIYQLRPKIVVLMITHSVRMEVVSGLEICQYSAASLEYSHGGRIWNDWIMDDTNGNINALKNIMAIQHLCCSLNIKLIITPYILEENIIDLARDLAHPGVESNKKCADSICDIINGGHNPITTCPYYNSVPWNLLI